MPVCADESCHDRASLAHLVGRYDAVNIKLDKTGGLTEALALRQAALAGGYRDHGRLHGWAPRSPWRRPCWWPRGRDVVDLDGPLLLAKDRTPGLVYDGSRVAPALPALWG